MIKKMVILTLFVFAIFGLNAQYYSIEKVKDGMSEGWYDRPGLVFFKSKSQIIISFLDDRERMMYLQIDSTIPPEVESQKQHYTRLFEGTLIGGNSYPAKISLTYSDKECDNLTDMGFEVKEQNFSYSFRLKELDKKKMIEKGG